MQAFAVPHRSFITAGSWALGMVQKDRIQARGNVGMREGAPRLKAQTGAEVGDRGGGWGGGRGRWRPTAEALMRLVGEH